MYIYITIVKLLKFSSCQFYLIISRDILGCYFENVGVVLRYWYFYHKNHNDYK